MITVQPTKHVLIDYIEIDIKHRILDVKQSRIKTLVESIEQVGRILMPLFVTLNAGRGPDSYQLVSGATRLAAAKQLGQTEVPIQVISGTADEIKQVEIEENLGRHDLTQEERERLEHARKMCRINIDKAIAEGKAYRAAHPEETAKAYAEADEIGAGATAALKRRAVKQAKSKRKHRKTGGKRGRPKGGIAAIARKHGVKPDTVRARTRAIFATSRKKPLSKKQERELAKEHDERDRNVRRVTCPKCKHRFEVQR